MPDLNAIIAEIGLTNLLLILAGVILIAALILLIILVRRREIKAQDFFANLEKQQAHTERMVRDEFARNRQESAGNREEIGSTLKLASDSQLKQMREVAGMQKDQLDSFSKQLLEMTQLNEKKFEAMRKAIETQLRTLQEIVQAGQRTPGAGL
jgi:DNA recombination protein RmuC